MPVTLARKLKTAEILVRDNVRSCELLTG